MLHRVLGWLLVVGTPALLLLTSVRLVAQPWFIDFEYRRPDFPADPFGFTQADRLAYGFYALEYLLHNEDVAYLSERALPDGRPMFNARELRHMQDVQAAVRSAFTAHWMLLAAAGLMVAYLAWKPERRPALQRALLGGGLLTLGLLGALVVSALLSWDAFFDLFHRLFFESGTWRFFLEDTLIRLYPEKFWFDAALTVGALMALGAAALALIGWRWRPGWQPEKERNHE